MFANRILILLFLFFIYLHSEEHKTIIIDNNIYISHDILIQTIQNQKDEYFRMLLNQPWQDEVFHEAFNKIKKDNEDVNLSKLNTNKLLNLLEKTILENENYTNYLRGIILFILNKYNEALPYFKKASDLGNRDALFFYSLYFTPYLTKDVDISMFYFLLKQSMYKNSNLPYLTELRWWGEKRIKPLLSPHSIVDIISKKNRITVSSIKGKGEYIYTPINRQYPQEINFDKLIVLTSFFKDIFFSQTKLASLDKQKISKKANPSNLISVVKIDEHKCEKTKPYLYTGNYKPENKCGKNLPFKDFIKIIGVSNPCLISNKKAHHYIFIYSLDYKNKKVYLIDGWTKNSFLLEDNNILGLKGKIFNLPYGNLIELSFDDFKNTVVGCVNTL